MEPRHLGALALILFGGYFLSSKLGIFSSLNNFWPIILIIVGLVALYQSKSKPKKTVTQDGQVIYEINGNSSALKWLITIPVAVIALTVGLVFLGLLAPFFVIFLVFIPVILFLKLGWAFLRLLVPIFFGVAPLLLLLGILMLIF